ncbi:hypothetical protein D3C71_1383790 [compost metagenome]
MRFAAHAAQLFQPVQQAGDRAGHLVDGIAQLRRRAGRLAGQGLEAEVVGEADAEVFLTHGDVQLPDKAIADLPEQQTKARRHGKGIVHGALYYFQLEIFSMEYFQQELNSVLHI